MKDFYSALKQTINNQSYTENGAIGYKSTSNPLVDLNFLTSSLRQKSEEEIIELWDKAYDFNPTYAIIWIFFAGDVRKGMGERRLFKILFWHYMINKAEDVRHKMIEFVPEYTRWDNLFYLYELLGTKKEKPVFGTISLRTIVDNYIRERLTYDMNIVNAEPGKPISLLAKWMPSLNTSSKETRKLARYFCTDVLGIKDSEYRKMLSRLRSYSNVVESKISVGKWEEVDYNTVPSKANLKYHNAFYKHDMFRREEYLHKLLNKDHNQDDVKINSSASFPYEIVRLCEKNPAVAQGMWDAYPNFMEGINVENVLVVRDGSGSMLSEIAGHTRAIDVANSLTLYFAEKIQGYFHDRFITFSRYPRLVDCSINKLKECKYGEYRDSLDNGYYLKAKLDYLEEHDDYTNTDIQAVFGLILHTAVEQNMTQEDLPGTILVISDMEFDSAVDLWDESLFDGVESLYTTHGFKLPKLVFWNVASRTCTIPMVKNELGLTLLSGFSATTAKMVLSNNLDPWDSLKDILDSDRYKQIHSVLLEWDD